MRTTMTASSASPTIASPTIASRHDGPPACDELLVGSRLRAIGLVLLAALLVIGTGCATPSRADTTALPDDLTVDVSVLVGRVREPAPTIDRRVGRYILFADGSMHADSGPSLRPDVRPGLTRRLRDDEVRTVWQTIVDVGLADADQFGPPTNDTLFDAPRGIVAHIVTIEAHGRRWQVIRAANIADETSPLTTPLVRQLAALAWETDAMAEALLPGGIRYDFGNDPHGAFRQVGVDPPPAAPRTPRATP